MVGGAVVGSGMGSGFGSVTLWFLLVVPLLFVVVVDAASVAAAVVGEVAGAVLVGEATAAAVGLVVVASAVGVAVVSSDTVRTSCRAGSLLVDARDRAVTPPMTPATASAAAPTPNDLTLVVVTGVSVTDQCHPKALRPASVRSCR